MSKQKDVSNLRFQANSKMNRSFSDDFKKAKVKEIIEKRLTVKQVCELYDVSRTSVYKWIYKFSGSQPESKIVLQMDSESIKTKRLLEQVAELERRLGQKQLEIDFLDQTLSVASTELGYDLKKKYAPPSSNIFGPINLYSPTK